MGSCYDKALDLLSRRAHFSAELGRKLGQRGFSRPEVAETLERLTAQGYVDDLETARAFAAERLRRNGWGRSRLGAELLRRGAPEQVVDATLSTVDDEQEEELARRAAERWRARGGDDPAALARHLGRKGFAPRDILRLVREVPDEG